LPMALKVDFTSSENRFSKRGCFVLKMRRRLAFILFR
jgi:hypothetical protein